MKRRSFLKAAAALPLAGFAGAAAVHNTGPLNWILQLPPHGPIVTATQDIGGDFWTIYVDGEATIGASSITLVERGWQWVAKIAVRVHENRKFAVGPTWNPA